VSLAVVASIVVGAAMLLAGGAKLAAGRGWTAQAAELGAPAIVVPVVPWIEIVLGAGLCAQLARVPFASAVLAVLAMFTVLLALRLAQGRHPPCACFGSWSATPLSWKHLARNAVLMALAVVAIAA
jgi:hypothetical protein